MTAKRTIVYKSPGPVTRAFGKSQAFVKGIKGPIGSGKSTRCVTNLIKNAEGQQPCPDSGPRPGVVMRRTAIIRNTYPELRTTTMKTWFQWMPQEAGKWIDQGPPSHTIKRFDREGHVTFEWEVIFVALDTPADVAKLLSMELSDAWINEAREVPKAILDGLTGRVGRYPARLNDANGVQIYGCHMPQILMDTNPPDTDHWWHALAERDTSTEHARQVIESMDAAERALRDLGSLAPNQALIEFFSQPGGLDPNAENIQNLDGGIAYYIKASAGKDMDWIKVYVNGEYGFVSDGKAVYPEYRDGIHCRPFELLSRTPIWIGLDFGLTPAAVFAQRTPLGQWLKHSELVTDGLGAIRFADLLHATLQERYRNLPIGAITGDPAGEQRQAGHEDEGTYFDILKARGIVAQPAPTNDPTKRREAVAFYMNQLVDGEPAMLVHPNCKVLRKAYQGGYCYRRVQVSGQDRYRDKPDKNLFSHVADADQYCVLGAGEDRTILKRDASISRANTPPGVPGIPQREPPRFAITD
jgi:hypothetical protein